MGEAQHLRHGSSGAGLSGRGRSVDGDDAAAQSLSSLFDRFMLADPQEMMIRSALPGLSEIRVYAELW
jgi:hypothetical protein